MVLQSSEMLHLQSWLAASFGLSFQRTPIFVTRDVFLVGRAKLDCLEGGTHEETLRPQVNPKVKCQRFREAEVLSRLLKDPRNTLDCAERE